MRYLPILVLAMGVLVGCGKDETEQSTAPVPEGNGSTRAMAEKAIVPDEIVGGEAAPAISQITETTLPGETLAMTGHNLDGAALKVWAEGKVYSLEPMKTAADRLLALVPEDMPTATYMIWPEKDEMAGLPIRVNGAQAWWLYPHEVRTTTDDKTLRLFGRNLTLEGATAKVEMMRGGEPVELAVRSSNPYHLEVDLPDDLLVGEYTVRCHNGTGLEHGWSETLDFTVIEAPTLDGLPVLKVDDFGATPDDDTDDSKAIENALIEAAQQGGAIVRFSKGTYLIGSIVETPDTIKGGLVIEGAGRGELDFKKEAFSGECTVIKVVDKPPYPMKTLAIKTPFTVLRKLNVVMLWSERSDRQQKSVTIEAPHVNVTDARFVGFDRRAKVLRNEVNTKFPTLFIQTKGPSHAEVTGNEFYCAGEHILVGEHPPTHSHPRDVERIAPPGSDYLRIANNTFIGVFTGTRSGEYVNPGVGGIMCQGLRYYNAKCGIIEKNRFSGLDREHGYMLGRMMAIKNSGLRNIYVAGNVGKNNGPHRSVPGVHIHMGEQIMFHTCKPHGGLFDVTGATANTVTLDSSIVEEWEKPNITFNVTDRTASQLPASVGHEDRDEWVALVVRGKGVGQYRPVRSIERGEGRATLTLAEPWRVTPDETSAINLEAMYRHIVVYGNEVDPGSWDPDTKTLGVLFWYNQAGNVVAGNTFRNMSYGGVSFNACYRKGSAWNECRGNRFENIKPHHHRSGEKLQKGCFVNYFHYPSTWPAPEDMGWFNIGNVERGDTGKDCINAIWIKTSRYGVRVDDFKKYEQGGLLLSVAENNRFENVTFPVKISPPAAWILVRNNVFDDSGENDIQEPGMIEGLMVE